MAKAARKIVSSAFLVSVFVCSPISGVTQQMVQQPIAGTVVVPPSQIESQYIVGEGDGLRVTVWKQPELSQPSLVVRPDGSVSLPLLGDVKVSGMTLTQIDETLVAKLKTYVNEPRVIVAVTQVASKTVYVTGEVARPGAYPLIGPLDILQLIAKAGGVTPYAHRKSMFVLRQAKGTKEKIPVNYVQIVRGKNSNQNIDLQPGDTVVVP